MTDTFISNYISNTESDVYAIYNLPEEVIAVLFAYYSRSEGSLKENLQKLIEDEDILQVSNYATFKNATEKAKKFHEKWVLAYGHGSVAEHCVVHMAIENISMLAAKAIEDCRLASYTEKSTRYVDYREAGYITPPELQGEALTAYQEHCDSLFKFYAKAVDTLKAKFLVEGMSAPEARVKACDACRNILPASTRTNLGMTVNAREFAHMISKLLSNSSQEIRDLGQKIKEEALKVCPTLLKYAESSEYLKLQCKSKDIFGENRKKATKKLKKPTTWMVPVVDYSEYGGTPAIELEAALEKQYGDEITMEMLKNRGIHEQLPRVAEIIEFTADISMDFGAYRDIQRHRIGTQLTSTISPFNFYEIEDIFNSELSESFDLLMISSRKVYSKIYDKIDGDKCNIAQYCLPMAFEKYLEFTINLRSLCHFIELRSKPQGHKNYREVAQQLHKHLKDICQETANLVRCSYEK